MKEKTKLDKNYIHEVNGWVQYMGKQGIPLLPFDEKADNAKQIGDLIIAQGKATKEALDKQSQERRAEQMKQDEKFLQKQLGPVLKKLAGEFSEFAQVIRTPGHESSSWSKNCVFERANGDTVKVAIEAVNPDYKSPDQEKKRAQAKMISEKIQKEVEGYRNKIVEVTTFRRATKPNISFGMFKKQYRYQGLDWNIKLASQEATETPES